jgi:GNAT superfamily N-acetyltransferase
VGWNQNEADWRVFLRDGAVRAMDDGDPVTLAATAAVLPLGPDLAWISMVLVRPDLRRRGLATRLMRWAVERLDGTRCVALDATPAGRDVYRRLDFRDVLGFTRWQLPAALPAPRRPVRPLRDADWPTLLAFDRAAFGAPRESLLRGFAQRLPAACWIAEDLSGFALGRDGLRLPQVGPVVAAESATAAALVAAAARAVGGTVLLDIADDAGDVVAMLEANGALRLRPFTRMARGAAPPGDAARLIAMGGPEFG